MKSKERRQPIWQLYSGLPKPVYVLFFATLINGVGVFVFPFLVLYLTQILGYTDSAAGLFITLASLAYLPGSLVGSKLADTFGRKKVALISQALASSMFIICGFLGASQLVPVFVMLHLLFDGTADPARGALHTDVTTPENRQASFSLTYLGHNLGYAVGPIIAGILFYRAPQWIFFGNGIAGYLSIALMWWKIKETKPGKEEIEASKASNSTEKAEEGGIIKALITRPRIFILALCIAFYAFAYGQAFFALPLYTSNIFGDWGATLYGYLMSVNGVVVVIGTPILIFLLKKLHPLLNIAIAGILYALGFSLMGTTSAVWPFFVLSIVYTSGEIIDVTNTNYYIANHTPMSHRARFNVIVPAITGAGRAIAPMIGGIISDKSGLGTVWLITGIAAVVGAVSIFILYLTDPTRKKHLLALEPEGDTL